MNCGPSSTETVAMARNADHRHALKRLVRHSPSNSLRVPIWIRGVSLKTIQARLGHQDFGTTANTYSHLLEGAQAEAVAKVDELMSRVKNRR